MSEADPQEDPWCRIEVINGREGSVSIRRFGRHDGADGVEMVRFDPSTKLLHIYPHRVADKDPSETPYAQVLEIRIDTTVWPWDSSDPVEETERGLDVLSGVPDGLGVVFAYGLTFPRHYRRLIVAVEEETKCTVLHLGDVQNVGVSGEVLHLSVETFLEFVRVVDRHLDRASMVAARLNDAEAHNVVAAVTGAPRVTASPGRLPPIKAMTQVVSGATEFDSAGRDELLRLTAEESAMAARENPEALGRLRHDLELVTLDELITQYRAALEGPHAGKESHWQRFLKENPFLLQQLFAAPVVYLGEQIEVNSGDIFGAATEITDFLLWNPVAGTAHLVEIKTAKTPLVAARPYRGNGSAEVYPPHRDLSGAVAQLQSQMSSARSADFKESLRKTAGMPDLDLRIVKGAIIAGQLQPMTPPQSSSFGRYREGLVGLDIITFDEVLTRLEDLHRLLTSDPTTP